MKIINFCCVAFIAMMLLIWISLATLTVFIPAGQVGVRIQQYALFGDQGVVKEDFGPGWHRAIPMVDKWYLYDSTVQTLEMSNSRHSNGEVIKVRTSDGYQVSVDVTVKYRIKPGEAHKLLQSAGAGAKFHVLVRTDTERICLSRLGAMRTEDFYNPEKRRISEDAIRKQLSESLRGKNIELVEVLLRNVKFDESYEGKIRSKKLADQRAELNRSQAKAAEMRGKKELIVAETKKELSIIQQEREQTKVEMRAQADLGVAKIRAEAENYATKRRADADVESEKLIAKGTLAIKQAEAKGEKMRNEAMRGVGGRTIVALEAARNLKLKDVTISSLDVDLLDVQAMAEKLGAKPEEK